MMTILYKISGTGWLSVMIDGKMVPVLKLTLKQISDLQIALKELGLEE